jgi:hypothetical protein
MLRGIIQGGTEALGGSRFSLVNLLPTAFFVAFMTALIASGAYTRPEPSLTPVLDEFKKNPGLAVAATLGIFLLAVLLRPFQVAIVQLLEGYWRRWRPLEFANDLATERHRRIRNTADITRRAVQPDEPSVREFGDVVYYARQLDAFRRINTRASAIVDRYPPIQGSGDSGDDRLMPTLLGNILRDGEDDAGYRYGLDMPVVYPRMYPSLSPKLDKAISAQLDMLDTTSALCVVFGLIALLTLPLTTRMDWWSLVPLVAMLMSLLAYRGAITTARGHSTLLATAFDLHRFDMLQALHYQLPLTPRDELELNRELSDFLGRGGTDGVLYMGKFRYKHPSTLADSNGRPVKPDRVVRRRQF